MQDKLWRQTKTDERRKREPVSTYERVRLTRVRCTEPSYAAPDSLPYQQLGRRMCRILLAATRGQGRLPP